MAKTPDFKYAPMFQIGEDKTEYRLISKEGVSTAEFEGKTILKVSKEALTLLAQQGFHDVEFKLRREHNLQVAKILSDPEASENDKYVALQFLRNAETAVKGILPFCQDTGTAVIHGVEICFSNSLIFWRKHQRMLRVTTTVVTAAVAVAVATEMMGDFT